MSGRADERARLNAALEHANVRVAALEGELEQERQRISRLRDDLVALDAEIVVDASRVDGARIRASLVPNV